MKGDLGINLVMLQPHPRPSPIKGESQNASAGGKGF